MDARGSRTGATSVVAGPDVDASVDIVLDEPVVLNGARDRLVLVGTKLRPPHVRQQLVPRQRLLDRLNDGADVRLTLLATPAGFGKTSLLASWFESAADQRAMAWVSLDKGDNDPVVLWSYVVEALRRTCPDIGDSIASPAPGARLVLELLLPRLVNALDAHPGITLILDDFHVLGDGAARDSLGWLVEQAPPSFQLVVATRREPDLPLARLRGHGDLLELRADDLRFTFEECDDFLNTRQLLGLSDDDVRLLVTRTDGWPAGVYLAALSLRRADDRHELITRFGTSNRHVLDFLEAEVMTSHDEHDREFLVRSSILESMSGPLCDAVLQREGSAAVLRRIARSNLFVVPEDDEGGWYRFHPLFAQLLRVELARRGPESAAELNRRAFEWHRAHGSVREAIEHAAAADMYDEAAELVGASWLPYVNAGRDETVLSWLDLFPEAVRVTDSRLLLAEGWVQWLTGRHDAIDTTLRRIETALRDDDRHAELADGDVAAGLACLRATLPRGADEQLGERAVETAGPESIWRPVACWARALGFYGQGDLEEADRWFAAAIELGPARGQLLPTASSLGYRSLIAGERGDRQAQMHLAEQAMDFVRLHGMEDFGVDAWHAVGAALAAQGRFVEAAPKLERSVVVARHRGQAVLLARALRSYAKTLRELREDKKAAAAEAEAAQILEDTADPRMIATRNAPGRSMRAVHAVDGGTDLTERELEILSYLPSHRSEADIARDLFVSHSTVHSHARAIYRKLGVSSRAAAVARGRELSLLRDEVPSPSGH